MKLTITELLNKLESQPQNSDGLNLLQHLKTDPLSDAKFLEVLETELQAENWNGLSYLVIGVGFKPVHSFLRILFRIVDAANPVVPSVTEDAIDIISELVSPETPAYYVEKLQSYLLKAFPQDVTFGINRKVVIALERIGNTEAIKALKAGLQHPDEILREDIQDVLDRIA